MRRGFTVQQIAAHTSGTLVGDANRIITGVSAPASAGPADLVFVDAERYLDDLRASRAGAALVAHEMHLPEGMTGIQVADPALAMARAIDLLVPHRRTFIGVSPHAFIGNNVDLGATVGIGPGVFVGDDVRIGAGTEIHPGVSIGRGTTIGGDCLIYAGVHIYHDTTIGDRVILHSGVVIGADGFGYVRERMAEPTTENEPLRHRKVRQVGRVVIEDDVEIGANTTVDRAALDVTRIGRGTKIDNLVTIGHNCDIGRHCIIIGQAGISGSTTVEDYVTIAGQAGLTGHLRIGTKAVIGAQSGVTKSVGAGQVVLGSPAVEANRAKKALALLDSLPEFKKRLAVHERRVAALERSLNIPSEVE